MARAAPFMVMKYSPCLCSCSRGGGGGCGGGLPLCVPQDIELPLPLRDTLNAPSRGTGNQQMQRPLGETAGITFRPRVKCFRAPSYFSKHAWLLNIKRQFILWLSQNNNNALFQPLCQDGRCRDLFVTSHSLAGKERPSLTAAASQNAQKANGSQVIFPLRIRSSSIGSPDFLTHKPTQTAEVSMRAVQGAWGSKPTLVL